MPGRKYFSKDEADENEKKMSELEKAVKRQKNRDIKLLIISVILSGLFGFFLCKFF